MFARFRVHAKCKTFFFQINKGVMGIRRVEKKQLRRIAKLTGGKLVTSFANMDGDDVIEQKHLGNDFT